MKTFALIQMLLFAMPLPQPAEVQQAGLEARRKIVSGDLEYELYYGHLPAHPKQEVEWEFITRDRLIFDTRDGWSAYLERWQPDEQILIKKGQLLTQRAPDGGNRLRIVYSPKTCYQFVPDEIVGGGRFGITADDPKGDPIESKIVMHPWKFGFIPVNFGAQHATNIKDFGEYVSPAEQLETTIDEAEVAGRKFWRVAFRRSNGRNVTTWFDPAHGMNVSKVVEVGATKFGTYVVSATNALKHDPEADVWFPEQVMYRGVSNNDEAVVSLEKLVVTNARFNIDIDPSQFTVKALKAPSGTIVISRKPEQGPTKQWDGEKLVPFTELPKVLKPMLQSPTHLRPAEAR